MTAVGTTDSRDLEMPKKECRPETLAIGIQRFISPGTGVASYSANLCRALESIAHPYIVVDTVPAEFASARLSRWLRAMRPFARMIIRSRSSLMVGDLFKEAQVHFDLYGRLLTINCPGPPGIVHWTYPVPLRIRGWRNIYTIHDVIPLKQPDLSPIDQRRHGRLLGRIVSSAARLVTVSESARVDIERFLGTLAGFVVNLGQGLAVEHQEPGAKLPLGLDPGGYFLSCGTIEPRKNLVRLAEAHNLSGSTLPLLHVGPDGWHAAEIKQAARDATPILMLDHLPRAELLRLIESARALVMPSLAEGFGLPVAEAMSLGVPVLTSNEGALAEVAGGAALLADPRDVKALAKQLRRLTEDPVLCRSLAERGRTRANAFSLRAYADRLSAFYHGVAHEG